MTAKKKTIGKNGTRLIYNNYGNGVTVSVVKDATGRKAYEITIPNRPKYGGGKRKEIKYANTVIEYAQASSDIIARKKERGRWK